MHTRMTENHENEKILKISKIKIYYHGAVCFNEKFSQLKN